MKKEKLVYGKQYPCDEFIRILRSYPKETPISEIFVEEEKNEKRFRK